MEAFVVLLEFQGALKCSAISSKTVALVVVFHIMQVNLFSK